MNTRRGLGKGLGTGYKNLVPIDSHIHSLSARGMKTVSVKKHSTYPFVSPAFLDKKAFGVWKGNELIEGGFKTKKDAMAFAKKRFKLNAYGMQPVDTYTEGDFKVEIYPDENPESPREWDNMGKMVCFHKRYELGDKSDLNSDDFNGWDELEDYLWKKEKAKIVLPVFLYDHSGLRMKVGSFSGLLPQGHAEFDSGQVGFIYATEKDIKDNFQVKKITKAILKKAEANLRGEIETYDQYLSGDVYGFRVVQNIPVVKSYPDGNKVTITEEKELDAVWGFYGSDEAMKEGKAVLKYNKEQMQK